MAEFVVHVVKDPDDSIGQFCMLQGAYNVIHEPESTRSNPVYPCKSVAHFPK